jgi:SAM-dependent methyltransferase
VKYANMAPWYNHIMLDGVNGPYYDYEAIAAQVAAAGGNSVLEAGCGTGLILQRLAKRRSYARMTGFDVTGDMLAIARDDLPDFQADLRLEDVTQLELDCEYDVVFSYGGPWYFVPDGDGYAMISHIRDDGRNAAGLARITAHLAPGGRFLLGIQDPHAEYDMPLEGGDVYSQRLLPLPGGFRKLYLLASGSGELLMSQLLDYRVYCDREARGLLAGAGLRPLAWQRQDASAKFLEMVPA